jgi:ribosomal protein S18 acetylase RimI-like enzyme
MTPHAARVRPYEERDEDAVIALWTECGLVRAWNHPRRDIERKARVQRELFLVAEEAGTVVGTVMAGFDGHRGWVNYLAVAPSAQGRGVGRELMEHAERGLAALGCPKVNLQVRSANEAVLGFYRRLGYVDDDVVSLGKRLTHDDAP